MKSISWPEGNKPASFEDVVNPLTKSLKDVYKLQRRHRHAIKYDGLPLGNAELACVMPISETFSKIGLEYHMERGRSAVDVIMMTAVQLGIEQGRRIAAENDIYPRFIATFAKLIADPEETDLERIKKYAQQIVKMADRT